MKNFSPLKSLECVRETLGSGAVVLGAAALFLFYGTLISFFVLITVDFVEWEREPFWDIPVGLVSLAMIGVFTWHFAKTSAYFAGRDFLPHLLDKTQNRYSLIVGVPLLGVAAFLQLEIYGFNHFDIALTLVQSLSLLLALVCLGYAVKFMSLQRAARRSKSLITLTFSLNLTLSLVFAGVFVFAVVYFQGASLLINLLVVAIIATVLLAVKHYYTYIAGELKVDLDEIYLARPSNVRAIVLLSKFNKPSIRAISFARATHKNLEILSIRLGDDGKEIYQQWLQAGISVPLRVFKPSTQDFTDATIEYIKSIQLKTSRDLIVVYLPHYTSKHWFEAVLHNQASRSLIAHLEKIPNVVISSVPWQRV
jgi:uncharacterized membrane protein YidH (DUF202 family)